MARLTADLEGGQTSADVLHRPKTAARVCAWEHIAVISLRKSGSEADGATNITFHAIIIETIRCETLDGRVAYMVKSGETCTKSNPIA